MYLLVCSAWYHRSHRMHCTWACVRGSNTMHTGRREQASPCCRRRRTPRRTRRTCLWLCQQTVGGGGDVVQQYCFGGWEGVGGTRPILHFSSGAKARTVIKELLTRESKKRQRGYCKLNRGTIWREDLKRTRAREGPLPQACCPYRLTCTADAVGRRAMIRRLVDGTMLYL